MRFTLTESDNRARICGAQMHDGRPMHAGMAGLVAFSYQQKFINFFYDVDVLNFMSPVKNWMQSGGACW